MLTYYQLQPENRTSMKFESKYREYSFKEIHYIWIQIQRIFFQGHAFKTSSAQCCLFCRGLYVSTHHHHMTCCRIWSWSPMPCGKHGLRDSVDKNRGRRPRFLSLLRPEGHVFHTAWETMIKTYYSTLTDWFFFILFTETWILVL